MDNLTDERVDTTFLELVQPMEPEKCQSTHDNTDNRECSVTVVAHKMVQCSGKYFPICARSLAWNAGKLAGGNFWCRGCDREISECWSIVYD